MRIKRMHKRMSIALLVFTITVLVVFNESARPVWLRSVSDSVAGILDPNQLNVREDIDIEGNDVLVVVNIPRTGILRLTDHVVRHSVIQRPCSCKHYRTKCQCLNTDGYQWLFNAWNTTGFVCGEHASYNDIKYHCPMDYWMRTTGKDKRPFRRYHLLTMMREPISRYISEWVELTTRDAYFLNEPRLWRKEPVELQKKGSSCWLGRRMAAVTLDDFVDCPDNPAHNRMTKMLANVNYVDAIQIQDDMKYKQALLLSAQNVLRRTAFFGLHHRLNDTQALLEEVLGAKLNKTIYMRTSEDNFKDLSPATKHKILMANDLDTKLYAFAKELFEARVAQWRQRHNKQSPIAVKKDTAVAEKDEGKKDEDDDEKAEDEEEEEEEEDEGEGEVVKASDVLEKKKEDQEKEEKVVKQEEDDEEEDEKDKDDEEKKADKASTAKPTTAKPVVASSDGTKPASTSEKTTGSSSKPTTGGDKDDKTDDKEKSEGTKTSPGTTTKTTASPPASKSSGSSGSNTGSVKSSSDDVSLFFSNLAQAKENQKGEKSTAKDSSTSAASKSSGGGGSGSAQNPSLGEKFRQLQNHPTHIPDMSDKEGKKGEKELGEKSEDNATVPETIKKTKDLTSQNQTLEGANGQTQNQNVNASKDGFSTPDEFLDPFGLDVNLTLESDSGFANQAAMNFTSLSNIDRLSTGLGQILTGNELDYSFDLVPGKSKLGQKAGVQTSSGSKASNLSGVKQKPNSGQIELGKGFQVDEFNFGAGVTLEEPKDSMAMGEGGQSDLLSGKLGTEFLDATETTVDGKTLEVMPGNVLNLPIGVTADMDINQLNIKESDVDIDGLGAKQGTPSDSANLDKSLTNSKDFGSTADLEWGEQGLKESISPMEPEIKTDDADEFAEDLSLNKDGSQLSIPGLDSKAGRATGLNANSLKFGEETSSTQSQTVEGVETEKDVTSENVQGVASENLAKEGLDVDQLTSAQNINTNRPENLRLTDAPDSRMQGRRNAPFGITFNAQRQQQGMGDFRGGLFAQQDEMEYDADEPIEQQDFDSPTARFRINQPMRRNPYRMSRPDPRNFEEYRGARMGRTRASLPPRSSYRRRRRSSRRGSRSLEFAPLDEEEKQVRSMFV